MKEERRKKIKERMKEEIMRDVERETIRVE
jgi:hypothetical protein